MYTEINIMVQVKKHLFYIVTIIMFSASSTYYDVTTGFLFFYHSFSFISIFVQSPEVLSLTSDKNILRQALLETKVCRDSIYS